MGNRHGLSRAIPEDVKRQVRQRCGFGCVICGSALYHYEHFEPEFADAASHEAEGIILLCPNHHGGKGSMTSRAAIAEANKNPFALRAGFSHGVINNGTARPKLQVGSNVGEDVDVMLHILGHDILSIQPPEAPGAPFRVNARAVDQSGKVVLDIVDNEIKTYSDSWDVTFVGSKLTIRSHPGHLAMVATIKAGEIIAFDQFEFAIGGVMIAAYDGEIIGSLPNGSKFLAKDFHMQSMAYFIYIDQNGIVLGRPRWGRFGGPSIGGSLMVVGPDA